MYRGALYKKSGETKSLTANLSGICPNIDSQILIQLSKDINRNHKSYYSNKRHSALPVVLNKGLSLSEKLLHVLSSFAASISCNIFIQQICKEIMNKL